MATEIKAASPLFDAGHRTEGIGSPKTMICEVTARLCAKELGACLRAVVLTGSLARDEATVVSDRGGWNVLGDAEFLIILRDQVPLPRSDALDNLQQAIETRLRDKCLSCPVHAFPVNAGYLRRLPPTIFAYELRTHGQVVWGEPHILSMIPPFSPSDIPLEDGWRLLSNRIVELLEVAAGLEGNWEAAPQDLHYRTAKLYLDMATSLLLFLGIYSPSYRERSEKLRILAEGTAAKNGCPFLQLRDFAERVSSFTKFKLQEKGARDLPAAGNGNGGGMQFWEETVTYARLLWRWELLRLLGERGVSPHSSACPESAEGACPAPAQGACPDPAVAGEGTARRANDWPTASDRELWQCWMQIQPLRKKLRGWAYVLRKCGWHRSARQWPRWARLACQASPRHWVYAAARELFFRLPELLGLTHQRSGTDLDFEQIWSWLPVERVGAYPDAIRDRRKAWACARPQGSAPTEGRANWQKAALEIAWNYHEFLEGTRA